jgi:hypothetical protein
MSLLECCARIGHATYLGEVNIRTFATQDVENAGSLGRINVQVNW